MSEGQERRQYRRIPARLHLTVELADAQGPSPAGRESVMTENVSPGDVYFQTSMHNRLQVGSRLKLEIELPASGPTKGILIGRHLQVVGQVVRICDVQANNDSHRGVAVRFLHTPRFASDLT